MTQAQTISNAEEIIDLLIHSQFIIPITPKGKVYINHSIVINKGVIIGIIDTEEAIKKYTASQTFNLPHHVLMPGLINAHGHSAMTLFRGLADDLPLGEWLNEHIWPAEGAWVSEEFVRDGTELAIAEMIRGGTSCFSDMYFFPDISADTAHKAGIRAQLCCPILDFPTVWGSGADDYIEKALHLADRYNEDDLITVGFGPHAPYTVSDEPLSKIAKLAKKHSMPVQIHLHETQQEVDDALKNSGQKPIARLAELGLISKDILLQCVHMTALNDDDISLLKNSTAQVIHCPESNLKLASGFCEIAKLTDSGINVALGTDGAASNNDLDMLGETRTAALIAKAVANNAAAINAATALQIATLNGAKALGIDKITGSLEPGKSADIIAINLDQLNSQPSFDPISDIVYSVASNQVSHNWVNGQLLLEDGELLTLDAAELIRKAKYWAKRISNTE